jgi:hypothetical protein
VNGAVRLVVDRSFEVILSESLTSGRAKCAEDIALATEVIIDLPPGSLSRARWVGFRFRSYQLPPR